VIVDATGGDEERVPETAVQRREDGVNILAGGRRVGDVDERVHSLTAEGGAHRGVILAVGHERAHAGGKPFGVAAAIEDGDRVTAPEQGADEVEAHELRAPDHEDAHVSRWPRPRRWWSASPRR
jgi:hypothetical protein